MNYEYSKNELLKDNRIKLLNEKDEDRRILVQQKITTKNCHNVGIVEAIIHLMMHNIKDETY